MFSKNSNFPHLQALGYWRNSLTKNEGLPFPTDYIDERWSPLELMLVVNHIRTAKPVASWLGFSLCRICSERLGTRCMSDGKYVFPEMFEHYLLEHDVKPPQEFIDYALGKEKSNDRSQDSNASTTNSSRTK